MKRHSVSASTNVTVTPLAHRARWAQKLTKYDPPASIDELIERSSLGAAMRDIEERGIDAHLDDLENEMEKPWRRR